MYLIKQDSICKMRKFFQYNYSKPTFNYPKYIKYLSKALINNVVDYWFKQQKINICNLLKVAFYHMFLRQSNYIKDLGIVLDIFDENIFNIHDINTFIINISNLTTLQLHYSYIIEYEIFSKFLQLFAKNCKNLKHLFLEQFNEQHHHLNEISLIIKSQYGLKKFDYHIHTISGLSSDIIFTSLEFQKDSLVSLKLYNIVFKKSILQSIIKLHKLKSFEINSFHDMTLELCEILEFASFKLRKLIIKNKFCKNNITIQIIKYLGITLEILKVKYMDVKIMEKIVQYNLNLKTLDIDSNWNLSILSYLKNIKVKNLNLYLNTNSNEKLFFIRLAESLSDNTTHISFMTWKSIDKNNLLYFLNNCHNYIISLNFKHKCELEHLKVILNYVKKNNNNNLKYLRICDINQDWSVKEIEILNQIKEKGVKLAQFIDDYKE
ncbi:hypothetical protein RclHR1_15820009 [Rhizophagus clarus]|nr:hypothetical protein RclHR1_15820009 [Rhizophagus clarus]